MLNQDHAYFNRIYETQLQVLRRMHIYRGETGQHRSFSLGSNASSVSERAGSSARLLNIEYSTEDHTTIEQRVRANVGTAFYSIGTCKIAPVEQQLGVVERT